MKKTRKERMKARIQTPLDLAGLTRMGEYGDGILSYSSRKLLLTDQRIGCSSVGQDAVWAIIHAGKQFNPDKQLWWLSLSDDDDWWASKEFDHWHEALDFYLKLPSCIGWDWIRSNNFTF